MINQHKLLTQRRKDAKDCEVKRKRKVTQVFILFLLKTLRLGVFAWAFFVGVAAAQTPVPEQNTKITQAAQQVQTAQDEVQKLKDAWDRSRLESTLYSQRAQRAYKRWAAAKKDWKKKMAQHKDEAQLEFELAVEKRKLAFDLWQQAQYRLGAQQQLLNAAESSVDIQATQAHIAKLQSQVAPIVAAPSPTDSAH